MAWELASFPGHQLELDAARIAELAEQEDVLEGVSVEIVRPGEEARITHVLDAVEPRARPDGRRAFPTDLRAGMGRTNRLDGVALVSCLDFPGEERPLHEQEAVIDCAGPGAAMTPFGGLTNVVLTFHPDSKAGHEAIAGAARRMTLAVAELLAEPTLEAEPSDVELFDLGPPEEGLPSIAALVQLSDLGQLYIQYVYGSPAGEAGLPGAFDPAELLDGAVTCGEYHWASMRNPTIFHQRNELVRALYREHGRRLNFAGLVLMRGYEQTAADKQLAADRAAHVARELGADGAIVTIDAGGNSHTDAMLTVRACERAGVRTAVVVAEQNDPEATDPALVDWVPEADCVISVGNSEELVPEWAPRRVVGGDRLLDGTPAREAGPIRVQDYLGATNQMGQLRLRARTW
jgi:glycine reductase complex component B subunit alpha and beta